MLQLQLPVVRIDYLQLAFVTGGPGLVARWGAQISPYTVATWDVPDSPVWQRTGHPLNLSPDGEWLSDYDKVAGEVRVTRVGASEPMAVVARGSGVGNVWTAVAPGGEAVAWKDGPLTLVRALPGGEQVARVKSGWGVDLRFSPGGRWLTETGERVFRVFDRTNNYRVSARIPTYRHMMAEVADGPTAVVTAPDRDTVTVWDISAKSATATLPVGKWVSALAVSADGRRVLTGNTAGEVTLWDAGGGQEQRYNWGVKTPIAAAFARDGMRAAVGGDDGQVVVWDLVD